MDQYGEYADDHVRTSRLARIPVATHLQSGKNVKKALLSISESFKNMSSTFLSDYLTEDDVNNIYNDLQQLADNNDWTKQIKFFERFPDLLFCQCNLVFQKWQELLPLLFVLPC